MANIREVARRANVSIATVSRVLNGHESVAPDLRRRVMTAVDACDYAPNTARRSQEMIALVYAGVTTPAGPYDSACIGGMVEALEQIPLDLTLINHRRDRAENESFRRFFRRKGVDGVILRCTDDKRDVARRIASEGVPMVVLGDHFEHESIPFVYSDSHRASADAVDHLCSLGHTRIAFATCERDDGDHVDRFQAYDRILREHGLYDESLVWRIPPHRLDGAQLMRAMMGCRNRPTAAFIADPLVAVGAMNEARSMGVRIPEDFSIVAVDDTDTRNTVSPKMTAVCQDSNLLGRIAVEHLSRMLSPSEDRPDKLQIPPAWLEINNSTGPPPDVASLVLPNGNRLQQLAR